MALKTVAVVGASLAGLRATETLRRDGFDGRLVLVGAEPDPAVRPAAALQAVARGRGRARRHRAAAQRRYDDLDLDLRLGDARGEPRPRREHASRLDDGRAASRSTASCSPPAARRACCRARPTSTACSCCARSTTRSRSARRSTPTHASSSSAPGSSAPRSRPRAGCAASTSPCSKRCPRRSCAGSARCSAWCAASCTATTASTSASASASPASTGHERVERVRLDDGTAVDADVVVVGVGVAPVTDWLEGSGLHLDNGVVCDATLLAAPGVVVRRRRHALAEPAVRRRADAARALDQRVRAGCRRGAAPALRRRRRARTRSHRCRSCGPTSTTARSRASATSAATTRWPSCTGRSTSAGSSRCSDAPAVSSARSGFSMPAKLMQYRRMIAERASFDAALEHARARGVTVAARHQRLPAEASVGSSRTCTSCGDGCRRARPPCSPPNYAGRQGVGRRAAVPRRARARVAVLPHAVARAPHRRARARDRRRRDLPRPVAAARAARRRRLRAAPYVVVVHGAEVTVPGRLPGSRATRRARAAPRPRASSRRASTPAREAVRAARRPLPGVSSRRASTSIGSARSTPTERVAVRAGVRARRRAAARRRDEPAGAAQGLRRAHRRGRRRLPDVQLAIAGGGPRPADGSRRRAAKRGLGRRVRFLGRVPDDALAPLLASADMFAMPCRDRWLGLEAEGFGIVFLEAAAAGVPVVAGRSGGSHEAVVDGATGFVVDGRERARGARRDRAAARRSRRAGARWAAAARVARGRRVLATTTSSSASRRSPPATSRASGCSRDHSVEPPTPRDRAGHRPASGWIANARVRGHRRSPRRSASTP